MATEKSPHRRKGANPVIIHAKLAHRLIAAPPVMKLIFAPWFKISVHAWIFIFMRVGTRPALSAIRHVFHARNMVHAQAVRLSIIEFLRLRAGFALV